MGVNSFVGSYLGFMFDDLHSSDMGLVRTSDGSRYIDNFLADFQDRTAQASGADGTYYYGTYFNKRNFTINVAFEALSDSQIRDMKRRFGDRKLHKLIFDETPYKYYWVKCSSSPTFKMLAFDTYMDMDTHTYEELPNRYDNKADLYHTVDPAHYEGSARTNVTGRIYKGEATLNFVAYDPFAHSYLKFINEYNIDTVPAWGKYYHIDDSVSNLNEWGAINNFAEWRDSVKLIRSDYVGTPNGGNDSLTYTIDVVKQTNKNVLVYNPGDFATPFKYKLTSATPGITIPNIKFDFYHSATLPFPDWYQPENPDGPSLRLRNFTLDPNDYGIQINMKLHLIEGIDEEGNITGTVYNKYIEEGDFFDIPIIPLYEECLLFHVLRLNASGQPASMAGPGVALSALTGSIEYDYLFY